MKCLSPTPLAKLNGNFTVNWKTSIDDVSGIRVNCGQCIACRIKRTRMWSLRAAHEASQHEHATFLTLTYSNEHLPKNLSVNKRDLQLFIKRLRRRIPNKIRYFACGEYGAPSALERLGHLSDIGRPHYHILIWGWEPDDCVYWRPSKKGFPLFNSAFLHDIWTYGYCVVGEATPETAQYIAGYTIKKVNGRKQESHYVRVHPETLEHCYCEPEFQLQSQGIGKNFLDQAPTDLIKGYLTYDGKTFGIPRYYLKQVKKRILFYESLVTCEKNPLKSYNYWNDILQSIYEKLDTGEYESLEPLDESTVAQQKKIAKLFLERRNERQSVNNFFEEFI